MVQHAYFMSSGARMSATVDELILQWSKGIYLRVHVIILFVQKGYSYTLGFRSSYGIIFETVSTQMQIFNSNIAVLARIHMVAISYSSKCFRLCSHTPCIQNMDWIIVNSDLGMIDTQNYCMKMLISLGDQVQCMLYQGQTSGDILQYKASYQDV